MENTFALYSILDQIKSSMAPWAANEVVQGISADISSQMDRIRTKRFRVAVVGEFKRGKSSLINTLLKREILPADVRPATATFNRIVYGSTPRAFLYMKDAQRSVREVPIADLGDYITELTEESLANARKIDEVVVEFPSMFCSDHVELIDTPGLNDNEEMTDLTVGRLKDIDLAIVAISAASPMSMTEANLVSRLLESPSVCQIVFAVTMIDKIPENDHLRLLNGIRSMISSKVLAQLKAEHEENDAVFEKYDAIIRDPMVFGLSAYWAQQALHLQNEELYIRSGYREFTDELPSILLTSRSTNLTDNALRVANDAIERFGIWMKGRPQELEQEIAGCDQCRRALALRFYSLADREKEAWTAYTDQAYQYYVNEGTDLARKTYSQYWGQAGQNNRDRITAMLQALPQVYGLLNRKLDDVMGDCFTANLKSISRDLMEQTMAMDDGILPDDPELRTLIQEKCAASSADALIDEMFGEMELTDFRWHRSPIPVSFAHADEEFLKEAHGAAAESIRLCAAANAGKISGQIETVYRARRIQIQTTVMAVYQYFREKMEKIRSEQESTAGENAIQALQALQDRARKMKAALHE